ncbi:hypothetical protein LCGC14_1653570 [marine sediment metagenome]|uniref:Uncharacterized protein n=1 Tax=marine sediment metagenome TaxID=412755 RepID=A0A0F9HWW1_9ZZZZ
MADDRDFRVRAFLYFVNEGIARGLYNHVLGQEDKAVDINSDEPNAEMKMLDIGDNWTVKFDLCFPPEHQDVAEGLYNHTKNAARNQAQLLPNPGEQDTGSVSIERCGHRTGQGCEITERYEVV